MFPFFAVSSQLAMPAIAAPPPNFLFIIADDLDTYSVNAYRQSEPVEQGKDGNTYRVETPNIDRLAREGMLFHQVRIMGSDVGAVCTASRTCIMTGKGSWRRAEGVTPAETMPGIFNRGMRNGKASLPYATYRTCKEGNSFPMANKEFQVVRDATKRGNKDGSGSEWHGDRALEFIDDWQAKNRNEGKQFLMYLGFSHPHDERSARPELLDRYGCVNPQRPDGIVLNPAAPPLPASFLPCTPDTFPAHPFDNTHLDVRDEMQVPGVMKFRTEAVVRNEIGRNIACTGWIDIQVGRVLARLEDPDGDGDSSDSLLENTYVIFTSDHGIAVGRHGLMGKQNLYEHSWKVPYIVRGPGISAGSQSDALVYLHDTFPTLCDLAGIEVPATISASDGKSFRALLEGKSKTHRDVLYGLYAGGKKPGIRAVTDGRFKLITYDTGGETPKLTQMFDLKENPFELLPQHGVANLADLPDHAQERKRLEKLLAEEAKLNGDPFLK